MALLTTTTVGTARAATYGVHQWIPLTPPTGGFDFVNFEPTQRRVYVAHATTVAEVDPDKGMQVASLTSASFIGVHGTAFSPDGKFAFVSSGGSNQALKVDLSSMMVVGMAATGANPDHILYDPFSNTVLTFNNGGASATVIDAATMAVTKTITFSAGSRPEVSVSDGQGKIYANLNVSNKLAQIDTATWTATEWALPAACAPTGIAMDIAGRRLFTACAGKLAITNADTGVAVGAPIPTGAGADGAAYDPTNKLVFTTNGGSGTLSVVKQMSPDSYIFVEDAVTAAGCRTNAFDPTTHMIYSVCSHNGVLSLAVIGPNGSTADAGTSAASDAEAADAVPPTAADATALPVDSSTDDAAGSTASAGSTDAGEMGTADAGAAGSSGTVGMAGGDNTSGGPTTKTGGGCTVGQRSGQSAAWLAIVAVLAFATARLRRRSR
jgi:DNA-binding beta-propeller fold protein YncE